ncbi:MAG: GNAT family N-acetyltransferase [Pyrinomonadaceae bacterium]|nr:GNAT family N-acetyltransferase [Pyrinomonadaceae bacterium]
MQILEDNLEGADIQELLRLHIAEANEHSPPESVHALDIEGLKEPDITFWTLREGNQLLGCGAMKEIDAETGEVKSMRTHPDHLRKGIGRKMLEHLLDTATSRGYKEVYLETGSMEIYIPARRLYERYGFEYCEPFADYVEDPNSMHMRLVLSGEC